MRRTPPVLLVLAVLLLGSGCFTTTHTIGDGPGGGIVHVHHNWYAAWGFIPLNRLDSREVVGGADSYRVSTGIGGFDVAFNVITGPIGFFRFTPVLEK